MAKTYFSNNQNLCYNFNIKTENRRSRPRFIRARILLMKVHNVMEEYVEGQINSLYDQLEKEGAAWLTCSCENCRLDATSYVLNRIPPRYIVSGRGAVYTAQSLQDSQTKADVNAVSMEAIRVISTVQRPYHKTKRKTPQEDKPRSPAFNFPVISGAVFDGDTFEPLSDAEIVLMDSSGKTAMHDISWSNPAKTFKSTKGSFSFWPEAIPAEKAGETKKISFTIEAKAEGYPAARQGFEIVLMSENFRKENISQPITMKVQDIILFKE